MHWMRTVSDVSKATRCVSSIARIRGLRQLLDGAPVLGRFPGCVNRPTDFAALRAFLDAAGVEYRVNPRLVRGLDYYNKTVFEWVTDALGAQGTVCAGGRYDGLVEQLGGKPTPGVGFAMGVERLLLMLEACGQSPAGRRPDVFVVALGDSAQRAAMAAVESLRDALPALHVVQQLGGGSVRSQMKKADKSGADFALLWVKRNWRRRRSCSNPCAVSMSNSGYRWQILRSAWARCSVNSMTR
jgi:histidyl-tRNA synthetase